MPVKICYPPNTVGKILTYNTLLNSLKKSYLIFEIPKKRYKKVYMHCTVCISPYRSDIEMLVKRGIPLMEISKKYHLLFKNSEINLYNKVKRHTEKKHPPSLADPTPFKPEEIEEGAGSEGITFQEYAKKLLRFAMTSDDMYTGKKLSHNQVIAAQRALTEESKVKTQENALKFAMVKFLRGQGATLLDEPTKLIEGDTEG